MKYSDITITHLREADPLEEYVLTEGMNDIYDIEVNASGAVIVYTVKGDDEDGSPVSKVILVNGYTVTSHFVYPE